LRVYVKLMKINNFDTFARYYIYFVTMLFGLCMGSFLNCCAYRMCHGLSIVKGRSECDRCKHQLGVLDLIPVFSYLLSGGKCRYCGNKLDPRYLFSEIVSGVVYVLIVVKFGLTIETIEYLILCSLMLCASFADLEDFIIPDILIIIGIVNRILFCVFSNNFLSELLKSVINGTVMAGSLLILVIVMEKILKKEAMGGGDIKLVFMVGLYLSIPQSLFGILVACVVGIFFAYAMQRQHEQFPFGPSLCIGYFISLLYGSAIISWYLSLFM